MKILCTGNPEEGLASAIAERFPGTTFVSRKNGYELEWSNQKANLAALALDYDIFINCSALFQFHQTMVLEEVYKKAAEVNHDIHIINIGSTTDRTAKGSDWRYQQEKKALRSTSNALNLKSVWQGGPKVSYVTFGTLENNQAKHPDRKVMTFDEAIDLIEYTMNMPKHLVLNEISVDPLQKENK